MMGKLRGLEAQGLVNQDLTWGIGEMILSSDHVGDRHQVIVDDAGEVVSSHAIGTDDDEVSDSLRLKGHPAVDEILERNSPFSDAKADDRSLTFGLPLGTGFVAEGTAAAIVTRHHAPGELLLSKGFQPFGRAETFVGLPLLKKPLCKVIVKRMTFGLAVRSKGSVPIRTFIPFEAQPPEVFEDTGGRFVGRAFYVRILDSKEKDPFVVPRKEVVEKGCTGVSNVKETRRRRSKTDPDRSVHLSPKLFG
jgi:hypothetical protein